MSTPTMGKPSSTAFNPSALGAPAMPNSTQTDTWGFLHPECHGQNALMFFSWDLAKTIKQQFTLHADSTLSVKLTEAQKAVDRLLNQYIQIQATPGAFVGHSITLHAARAYTDSTKAPGMKSEGSRDGKKRVR